MHTHATRISPYAAGWAIQVVHFDHGRATTPYPHRFDWPALVRVLNHPRVVPREKWQCPAVSFATYRAGHTRGLAGVVEVTALALDYDGGTDSIETALSPWSAWPYLWYTSWSHSATKVSLRVVLPLARPVPVAQWGNVYAWAVAHSDGTADPIPNDASRLWYLPVARAGFAAGVHDWPNQLLDVDWAALANPTPVAKPKPKPDPPSRIRRGLVATSGLRAQQHALNTDLATRRRAADTLHARYGSSKYGEVARHMDCPSCGRTSVKFYLDPASAPGETPRARCNHLNSCGWVGFVDQLLAPRGGS